MPSAKTIDSVCLAFAAWTVLVHAAGVLGAGTWALVWTAALAGAAGLAWTLRRGRPVLEAPDGAEKLLWAFSALAVGMTLLAHRPDGDDGIYISIAAGMADFPSRPLLRFDATYGLEGLPIFFPPYRLHSIEALYGTLSLLTGMSAVAASHLVSAPFWALMAPLALARFMRASDPRNWAWGVAGALAFLLMDGAAHGSWGNIAFARMFQGKAVFLTVFLPLVLAYALEFARSPSPRGWLLLFAALVASVGVSSTAVWVGPLMAGAALLGSWRPGRGMEKPLAAGFAACLYPLGAGLLMRGPAAKVLANLTLPDGAAVPMLLETVRYGLGPHPHAYACLALAAAAAFFRRSDAPGRTVALLLAFFLFIFNPVVAPQAALSLLGPPTFWRVFWILPLPLLAGMAAMLAADSASGRGVRILAGLVLASSLWTGRPVLAASNGVTLKAPGLKVPAEYPLVLTLNAAVPPGGLVLAPDEVSLWMVTQNRHPHPLLVKFTYYDSINQRLSREELETRKNLMAHVGGYRPRRMTPDEFERALKSLPLAGACIDLRVPWNDETRAVLRREGFRPGPLVPDYEIWLRP